MKEWAKKILVKIQQELVPRVILAVRKVTDKALMDFAVDNGFDIHYKQGGHLAR